MSEKIKAFIKRHPIFTYFMAQGIIGKLCRMIVDVVRSFTGKYPPNEIFIHYPEIEKANVKQEETTETSPTTEEETSFQDVFDKIKADEDEA